jgi:hypothetical protein
MVRAIGWNGNPGKVDVNGNIGNVSSFLSLLT